MSYTASWLPGHEGYRGHLSIPWGADPAKTVWTCPHDHASAREAAQCATEEAGRRWPESVMPAPLAADRVARALEFASYATYDGEHHKVWAIDQMVRALTGCPVIHEHATDWLGQPYEYDRLGESEEYLAFVTANGGINWDTGIAP